MCLLLWWLLFTPRSQEFCNFVPADFRCHSLGWIILFRRNASSFFLIKLLRNKGRSSFLNDTGRCWLWRNVMRCNRRTFFESLRETKYILWIKVFGFWGVLPFHIDSVSICIKIDPSEQKNNTATRFLTTRHFSREAPTSHSCFKNPS